MPAALSEKKRLGLGRCALATSLLSVLAAEPPASAYGGGMAFGMTLTKWRWASPDRTGDIQKIGGPVRTCPRPSAEFC